jgi:AraC-like DNA-binding protein
LTNSEALGALSISTQSFPREKRLAMWREIYGRNIGNFDIEPIGDTPFHADVTFQPLPGIGIAIGSRSAAHYRITRELARQGRDTIVLSMLRSGVATTSQFGKEATCSVGQAVVLTSTDPSTSTLHGYGSFATLAFARPAIEAIIPDLSSRLAQRVGSDNAALRLLIKYLGVVMAAGELASPEIARSAAAHILDLAALAIGARGDRAEIARRRGAKAARLSAIRTDILAELGRQDLSVELMAARHGISQRYVGKLFEEDGTTFRAFVVAERVAKAYRMLTDQRYGHLSIAQIAYDSGFGDISYFNRTFRRIHGATPSDIRESAMRGRDR